MDSGLWTAKWWLHCGDPDSKQGLTDHHHPKAKGKAVKSWVLQIQCDPPTVCELPKPLDTRKTKLQASKLPPAVVLCVPNWAVIPNPVRTVL